MCGEDDLRISFVRTSGITLSMQIRHSKKRMVVSSGIVADGGSILSVGVMVTFITDMI